MELVLSIIVATLLISLASLHLFWVFGGKRGLNMALPTGVDGKRLFTPSKPGTLLIAIGLLFFALINLCALGLWHLSFDRQYIYDSMYVISIIFLLRFIGDFKYVGAFKKYKQSAFALRDTFIYSPLCLFLSLSNAFLASSLQ